MTNSESGNTVVRFQLVGKLANLSDILKAFDVIIHRNNSTASQARNMTKRRAKPAENGRWKLFCKNYDRGTWKRYVIIIINPAAVLAILPWPMGVVYSCSPGKCMEPLRAPTHRGAPRPLPQANTIRLRFSGYYFWVRSTVIVLPCNNRYSDLEWEGVWLDGL